MAKCTWHPCTKDATHDEPTADGKRVWAKLCDEHHDELMARVNSGDARKLISGWVHANGGATRLTQKIMKNKPRREAGAGTP